MMQVPDIPLTSKIMALLHLLEDDSVVVRDAVTMELRALGVDISRFADENNLVLTETQYGVLDVIFQDRQRRNLLRDWEQWLGQEEDLDKLEYAMTILSRFQNGSQPQASVPEMLNGLADTAAAGGFAPDHRGLARYLFHNLGFSTMPEGKECADGLDLARVIQRRRGLPAGLVCLYVLLGRRFGLDSTGCNWPGSCYARFLEGGVLHVVDFSNHGVVQTVEELLRLQGPSRNAAESILTMEMTPSMLVRRIVSKLAAYYRREGNSLNSMLAVELLRMVDKRLQQPGVKGSAVG